MVHRMAGSSMISKVCPHWIRCSINVSRVKAEMGIIASTMMSVPTKANTSSQKKSVQNFLFIFEWSNYQLFFISGAKIKKIAQNTKKIPIKFGDSMKIHYLCTRKTETNHSFAVFETCPDGGIGRRASFRD